MKINKTLKIFLSVIILMLFFNINFRFTNSINCCSDDFDYFIHAETISQDFDFDYSNQLKGYEKSRFYKNGKSAPVGYVGSGLLASPFMFFGNLLDSLSLNFSSENELMGYKILIYSLSPIFYLFFGLVLIHKTLSQFINNLKSSDLILFFFGSGIAYYAFNRFSMTHAFEYFSTCLVLFLSFNYYSKIDNDKNAYLIPLGILLGLLIRWTNYFLLFIPIFSKIILQSEKKLITNFKFQASTLVSVGIFAALSNAIYGFVTIDPRSSYQVNNSVSEIMQSNIESNLIFSYISRIVNIFISQEFGIVYFMPLMGFVYIMSIFSITLYKKYKDKSFLVLNFIAVISISQLLVIVALWRSTASSYGYRYLYVLYPFVIVYYYFLKQKFKLEKTHNLLLLISIFSILSVLFFEATPYTQLSTERIYNSFGKFTKYTQPNYLIGYIKSIFIFEGYLKIFTTSFLGSTVFKILVMIFGKTGLVNFLDRFGLPVNNPDFINYLDEISLITLDKFIFVILFCLMTIFFIRKYLVQN